MKIYFTGLNDGESWKFSIMRRLLLNLKIPEVRFVLLTLVIIVAVSAFSTKFQLTWRSGFVLAFGMYALLCWFSYKKNDRFLKRLLLFGVAAGFVELLANQPKRKNVRKYCQHFSYRYGNYHLVCCKKFGSGYHIFN